MIRNGLALLAAAALATSIGAANAGEIPEILGSVDVSSYQPLGTDVMQQTRGAYADATAIATASSYGFYYGSTFTGTDAYAYSWQYWRPWSNATSSSFSSATAN